MSANGMSDAAREIVATRVFDAPRELVWKLWTEPEHIAQWWGPTGFRNTIQTMDVRPGGDWIFVMHGPDGTDYKNHSIYREVVKPSLLRYSHISGPLFEATATFTERGEQTEVTMRMVFESAELRDRVAEQFGAVEGLQQTLGRLADRLKAMKQEDFIITRELDAPRDLVFRVWTECEHLSQWWGPKGFTVFHCNVDLRPGGTFHYGMRAPNDGPEMWGKFVYVDVARPERLVYLASFSDAAGATTRHPMAVDWPLEMKNTVTFEEKNGKTLVTLRSSPHNASEREAATFHANHASMNGGFSGTFATLEAYLTTLRSVA